MYFNIISLYKLLFIDSFFCPSYLTVHPSVTLSIHPSFPSSISEVMLLMCYVYIQGDKGASELANEQFEAELQVLSRLSI